MEDDNDDAFLSEHKQQVLCMSPLTFPPDQSHQVTTTDTFASMANYFFNEHDTLEAEFDVEMHGAAFENHNGGNRITCTSEPPHMGGGFSFAASGSGVEGQSPDRRFGTPETSEESSSGSKSSEGSFVDDDGEKQVFPGSSITIDTPAVCFGWTNHPGTTKWRDIIDGLAVSHQQCPKEIVHIATEILSRNENIHRFVVCVNEHGDALKSRVFGTDKEALFTWRVATAEDVEKRTRERFNSARKQLKRSLRSGTKRPIGRPRKSEENCKRMQLSIRKPWYPIPAKCVCFEWKRHPGTVMWLEVVKSFAGNMTDYPEWNDDIVDLLRLQLAEENVILFLVFRDSKDEPCISIHEGLWVQASDSEILETTREQFRRYRQQLILPTVGLDSIGNSPNGGSPSGGPSSPEDRANHDNSSSSNNPNSAGSTSGPNLAGGMPSSQAPHCRQNQMNVDDSCSDLTSSLDAIESGGSQSWDDAQSGASDSDQSENWADASGNDKEPNLDDNNSTTDKDDDADSKQDDESRRRESRSKFGFQEIGASKSINEDSQYEPSVLEVVGSFARASLYERSVVPCKNVSMIEHSEGSEDFTAEPFGDVVMIEQRLGVATTAAGYATSKPRSIGAAAARHLKNVFAAPLQFSEDFKAPVFEKTAAEQEFIVRALKKNFVFSNLTIRETDILVDAFERQDVKANNCIIQQGDAGDFFYVIWSGDCLFIVNGTVVGKGSRGQTFGELALLYKSPRAASVKAESDCVLFRVDQSTFRYILQTQTKKAESDKRDLVMGVPFLLDLDPDDVTKLVSAMRPRPFTKGDYLVKKGEEGDAFYLIQEGNVKVSDISIGTTIYEDQTLGPGDYFGERALVTHDPRAANCIAMTDGIALVIDQPTFDELLGSFSRLILKSQDKRRLGGIKLFADMRLEATELSALAKLIIDEHHMAQETIVTEGVAIDPALYLVREGSVEVVTKTGDLLETVIVESGGYFGEELLKTDVGKNCFLQTADSPVAQPQFTATALGEVVVGRLTLAECRNVIDMTQLGYSKQVQYNSVLGNNICLEDLERHRILGAGTFGQVWLVSKKGPTGRKYPFALKIQSKYELVENQQVYGVIQEKSIMSTLQHPFIISLVQAYQDNKYIYMLLELVQGGELFSIMHKADVDGVFEADARFYAACILEGLSYMHRRKILYRDLQPENVLISIEGYPVIVDLGFAKVVPGKTFTLCGTPLYMAPEVILNRGHDKGADHWSFGVLIYEMLTGVTPFYENGMDQIALFRRICKGSMTFPNTVLPSGDRMSAEAEDLIKHLLVTNPSRRIGSLANGEKDIYHHLWFRSISFSQLLKREIKAPWTPVVKDPLDCSSFEDWDHVEDKTTFVYPRLSPEQQNMFASF